MALQATGNIPPLSALDREALALLASLRANAEAQQDYALAKTFNDTIAFATGSASSPAASMATTPASFPLVPVIQIDTSGEEGENGLPGTAAASRGAIGLNGTDGFDGQSARDINLQLLIKDCTLAAQWDTGNASLKLGDPAAAIFLRAVGGKGGNGGYAGKGGVGIDGAPGRDASESSCGTDGEKGRPGGPGGNGGDGGNGGKGGAVKVYVSPEDTDLLMLLNTSEVAGGGKGKGGAGGRGGAGGKGGQGGAKHSWTETKLETTQMYNSSTRSYYAGLQPRMVSRSNPGGSNGSQGTDGYVGRFGDDGRAGLDGSFQLIVGGTVYQSLYDLTIKVSKIVDLTRSNPDDVYEPGELVKWMVAVTNTGGMPTPSQDIEISLGSANWMVPQNSFFVLKDPLPVEGSHAFSTPFSFRVHEQAPVEEPLDRQEMTTYNALLRRVNKSFSRVSQQNDLFPVRYPVQISSINGKASLGLNEKSTLSLFVHNVSSILMGKSGPQKRRVFVVFEIAKTEGVNSSDVELISENVFADDEESHQLSQEVDHLSPARKEKVSAAFRFTNPALPLHSKVGIVASLYLDYFNAESGQQLGTRCIQKRTLQMQLC